MDCEEYRVFDAGVIALHVLLQVKNLFKELKVECNVVELDLIGKTVVYLCVCVLENTDSVVL